MRTDSHIPKFTLGSLNTAISLLDKNSDFNKTVAKRLKDNKIKNNVYENLRQKQVQMDEWGYDFSMDDLELFPYLFGLQFREKIIEFSALCEKNWNGRYFQDAILKCIPYESVQKEVDATARIIKEECKTGRHGFKEAKSEESEDKITAAFEELEECVLREITKLGAEKIIV